MSALEAFVNASVGLLVSWLVTYTLLPIWGLAPSAADAVGITALYFGISFVRSWAIREAFRKWLS